MFLMERKFNNIYRKLVDDEFDIGGHIAYSLYKADKECFIEDFKKRNDGQIPKEDDLLPFHNVSCLEPGLVRYKLMAKRNKALSTILCKYVKELSLFLYLRVYSRRGIPAENKKRYNI